MLGPGARQASVPESTHWFKLSDSNPLSCILPHPSFLFSAVTQCVRLCNPTHCSLPGSSVPGILQARILERVAISSSRGSSQFRDQIHVSCISCIGRQLLYHWATWEVSTHRPWKIRIEAFVHAFPLLLLLLTVPGTCPHGPAQDGFLSSLGNCHKLSFQWLSSSDLTWIKPNFPVHFFFNLK